MSEQHLSDNAADLWSRLRKMDGWTTLHDLRPKAGPAVNLPALHELKRAGLAEHDSSFRVRKATPPQEGTTDDR